MKLSEIQTWWQRFGCVRNPGTHTGEESLRDAEIKELREALAAAEKDAERYQKLRTDDPRWYVAIFVSDSKIEDMSGDDLDAALDNLEVPTEG